MARKARKAKPSCTKCSKCGSKRFTVMWHQSSARCQDTPELRARHESGGEHLHYKCRVCGYDWTEPTKDKQG